MIKKIGISVLLIIILLINLNSIFASTLTVCSSGCNHTSIRAAINNASNGDTINVDAGTYTEDLVINSSKNNLEIVSNNSSTIKGINHVISASFPLALPNIEILGENIKIHGFTIESPDYATGYYSSGIVIGGKNIEIYNNNFLVNSVDSADDISQVIQTYSKSAMSGVDISGLNIHNNIFSHKGTKDWGYEGIYINPDTGVGFISIENNNFNGKILRAITSERSKTYIRNNSIITESPISADDLSSAGGYQGINIRNLNLENQSQIIIEKNTIKGSDSSKGFNQGIRIGQTGQSFLGIEIKNNTINYNKNGILLKVSEGVKIN